MSSDQAKFFRTLQDARKDVLHECSLRRRYSSFEEFIMEEAYVFISAQQDAIEVRENLQEILTRIEDPIKKAKVDNMLKLCNLLIDVGNSINTHVESDFNTITTALRGWK